MMNGIAISPENEALTRDIDGLRQEFLKLYTQKDRMLSVERDDIYIRYMELIGKDKYENFRLSVQVRALKMRCELAQAAVNRNEKPDVMAISHHVDSELKGYYKLVEEQAQAIKEAQDSQLVSSYDIKEMSQLFRLLVKKLHPDLHPDLPDNMKDLFIQGQTAYRTHNIQLLREIIMRLDLDKDIDDFVKKSEETLEQIRDRLKSQIAELKNDIEVLLASFPFNIQKQIKDQAWVNEQKEQLKLERQQLDELKAKYNEHFKLIIDC